MHVSISDKMNNEIFQFKGRGLGTGCQDEPYRHIRCGEGSVMVISYLCHGTEFVLGYCRRVTVDRWGVYIHDPFRRASNATLSRSWAEPSHKGLFLFRPMRLEIITEQDWMRADE
jgi:hypothetical protein